MQWRIIISWHHESSSLTRRYTQGVKREKEWWFGFSLKSTPVPHPVMPSHVLNAGELCTKRWPFMRYTSSWRIHGSVSSTFLLLCVAPFSGGEIVWWTKIALQIQLNSPAQRWGSCWPAREAVLNFASCKQKETWKLYFDLKFVSILSDVLWCV